MLAGVSLFGAVLSVPHPSYLIASAVIVIVLVNIVVSQSLRSEKLAVLLIKFGSCFNYYFFVGKLVFTSNEDDRRYAIR
jgi:hypothetical protein